MVEPAGARRRVQLSEERPFQFGDYQMNYLNYRDWRIIPSTDIYIDDTLYYRSNRYGCQGPDIEEGRPVVAFFGDSVVHGEAGDSFVHHVAAPPAETLNGGIEGLVLPRIIDRFFELREKAPMVCAAVHTGWHNLLYNEHGDEFWAAQLDRIAGVPVIAHFTLFADISDAIVAPGYDTVYGIKPGYSLWHGADLLNEDGRARAKAAIDDFNRFIRAYCRDRGRVLIDLEPLMAPRSVEALGARFVDFLHPSLTVYDEMARQIEAQLCPALAAAGALPRQSP